MALLVALLVALRPALGRPRDRRHAGLRRQPAAAAAAGRWCWRVAAWAATSWVMIGAIPDANQTYREITAPHRRRPRRGRGQAARLLRGLPRHRPLRARDAGRPAAGRTCSPPTRATPEQPVLYLAARGRMLVDRAEADHRDGARGRRAAHAPRRAIPTATRWSRFDEIDRARSIPRASSRAPARRAASAR